MQEDLLHHIWKFRLFDQYSLVTDAGEMMEIIKPGEHNFDAGPDFFNAQLIINGIKWVGNVEIHVNASDWMKHHHDSDPAYDNVILHVVYENDHPIKRKNGELIPTLELKNRMDKNAYERYLRLNKSKDLIPCGDQIAEVDEFILSNWLDRILTERLESKSQLIIDRLKLSKNNWEETFYLVLARNFGFKVNNEPFESLARSLPLHVIAKHKHDRFQLEALLYGQAGMLQSTFEDEYPMKLKKEYEYLRKKFSLQAMDAHLWKFSRMMPGNFPSIRISQFADLISRSSHLFSKIVEAPSVHALQEILKANTSKYWLDHYIFDKRSPKKIKSLGKESIAILIINAIVPYLFIYGKARGEEGYVDRAFQFLENIEGEKNVVISNWKKRGVEVGTAFRTQALLQLKKEYCDKKRCLNCAVGVKLLSKQSDPQRDQTQSARRNI